VHSNRGERMSIRAFLRSLLCRAYASISVASALRDFRRGRVIDHRDWENILKAHCITNGGFTERLTPLLRRLNPPRPSADATGLLGHFTVADQRRIAECIARDGYYIFEQTMPESICSAIENFARTCPAYMEDEFGLAEKPVVYDPEHLAARLYKFRENDSLSSPAVQALAADDAMLRIAETYLRTRAGLGAVDSWWSAPYGNGPSSQVAQLFHFDFDAPPRWLKLFLYVTPVGTENGPHVYVRGSHRGRVAEGRDLIKRGYVRIPDTDIREAYGHDKSVEITGRRGTVFLADTRGFHKGKHPTGGDRLICQLLYCSPVFSDRPAPSHRIQLTPEMAAAVHKNPMAYARYLPHQQGGTVPPT
jgi:hypothetical protein